MAVTLNIWGPNAKQMLLSGEGAGHTWQPYMADADSSSCIIDHVGAKANFNWPRRLLQSGGIAGVRLWWSRGVSSGRYVKYIRQCCIVVAYYILLYSKIL